MCRTVRKLRSIYTSIPYIITKQSVFLIFVRSLLDNTETVRSPRDIKKVSSLTQEEVNLANFDSIILGLFNLITYLDIETVFIQESIFIKEINQDLASGVITRSAGNINKKKSNETSIEEIMEQYIDLDDILDERTVQFS